MIRLVKGQFPKYEPYMFSTELVIGNKITISLLLPGCWSWGISGLGLSKTERELFNSKRFEFKDILNFYFGKLLISYNKDGFKNHMKNVFITSDKALI